MGTPPDPADAIDSRESDSLLAEVARAPSVEAPSLRLGSMVGRYRLDALLGQGGMGVVYRAHDSRLNRTVALKLVRDELLADPSRKARLLREARAAAALSHANVVATFDAGEDGGLTYLAMELIEGETLRARLAKGPLSIADALAIGRSIASALAAAHAERVLHRDLKPDNVMLADGGVVKVLDFGLAKSLASDDADLGGATTVTAEGVIAGTPAYMSPEQLEGRELDARSDVFAFGIVLYEMLAGARPFTGDTSNAVIASILRDTPKPLAELRSDTPLALAELIEECLAKKPDGRPASGEALVERLAAVDETALATRTRTASKNRRRWPALALAGVCVALAGSLIFTRSRATSAAHATASQGSASSSAALSLSDNDTVLACPQLEATGVEEPQGWLGAAAADIVCRRALWMLGGKLERIAWPAALLDLPRLPSDDFPSDPYGAPGARERALTAAKRRANVYLDGAIAHEGNSFSTHVTLRRVDGRELASGSGRGRLLHEAMNAAVVELEHTGALPHAHVLDPEVSRWLCVKSANVQLALDDLDFGWAPKADACAYIKTNEQLILGGGTLTVNCPDLQLADSASFPPLDEKSPGEYIASVSIFAVRGRLPAAESTDATIDAIARGAESPWAQSMIAGTREVLLETKGDAQGAIGENMKALAATPSDPNGWMTAIGLGDRGTRLAAGGVLRLESLERGSVDPA